MEIKPLFKTLYQEENLGKVLEFKVEKEYSDKNIRLVFLNPENVGYTTMPLVVKEQNEVLIGQYPLPIELLPCEGNLFCQLQLDDGKDYLLKDEVLCLKVLRGLGDKNNQVPTGDGLITLSELDKRLTELEQAKDAVLSVNGKTGEVELTAKDVNAFTSEETKDLLNAKQDTIELIDDIDIWRIFNSIK